MISLEAIHEHGEGSYIWEEKLSKGLMHLTARRFL